MRFIIHIYERIHRDTYERDRFFHVEGADLTCSVLFALKGLFKIHVYVHLFPGFV